MKAVKYRGGRRRILHTMFVVVVCISLLTGSVLNVFAATASTTSSTKSGIYLNGRKVLVGECVLVGDVTYVPFRSFCNLFAGGVVKWSDAKNTASYERWDLTIDATLWERYIIANGHYLFTVEPIRNYNGCVHVPLEPMARAFALSMNWNAKRGAMELTSGSSRAIASADYRSDEVYWLSRIISAEAKGEPLQGQIAVGNVILNRVASTSFPNTIYGVIFDRKYGLQFSPVGNGTIYQTPTSSAVIAAKICLEGYTLSREALYFLNPRIATSSWIRANRTYLFTIENHDFYR